MKRNIDVCLTPNLIEQHDLAGKVVVVTDVFRATSCMVAGLATGVKSITPVLEVEECLKLQAQGYLAGGERHAKMIEGFDLDNSPFSYMADKAKGKDIAMTTTNGTLAINKAKGKADEILVASFSNLSPTAKYLQSIDKDVIVICAGWKGRPGLEDILFAGALVKMLSETHENEEDSTHLATAAYEDAETDMVAYLQRASHLKRLKNLAGNDIPYCLIKDQFDVVIHLVGDKLQLKD
ncbi:2-phosphosulfolactate phosphatase [uncultured Arcticibacterium sp.]|uniref:2-phosphosulfolactate phosphatase n=1 Tax=uncultured Arcticibacterium sp. TaxID=2173042 RepID=UPI0030FCA49A